MSKSELLAEHDAVTEVTTVDELGMEPTESGVRCVAAGRTRSTAATAAKISTELAWRAKRIGADSFGWTGVPCDAGWHIAAYVGASVVASVTHEDMREALALLYGSLLLTEAA